MKPQEQNPKRKQTCIETFRITVKKTNIEKETTSKIQQEINAEKVSTNDAERVEKGSKMEPKWSQKSSKIYAEIEVQKSMEKVTLRIPSSQ